MKAMQIQDLGRLQQIVTVLAKNGFGHLVTAIGWTRLVPEADPTRTAHPMAHRVRQALIDLGPTWVKLGQVLSIRPDIVPAEYIAAFQSLQDQVAPMEPEVVRACVEEELGQPLDTVFEHVDPTPLGSASIAQVHRAILKNGREVALKVQRRGIEAKIRADIHILYALAALVEGRIAIPGLHTPTSIVREFDVAIHNELDFVQELRAAERFRLQFQHEPRIVIPEVYPQWSTRRMLVMERLQGTPLSKRLPEPHTTPNSRALAKLMMDCSYDQVFVHGFFHGDPHPGNLMVTSDNRLIILDFGLTGTLTGTMQDTLIAAFTAVVFKDPETLALTIYRAGGTPTRVNLKDLSAEIERLMAQYHGASLDELSKSPGHFIEIIAIANQFAIRLPPEFAILSRAFGLLEASIRGLLPGTDILEEVKPYAQRLVLRRLSPDRMVREITKTLIQFQNYAKAFPVQLSQVLIDLEQGQLQIHTKDQDASYLREEIRAGVLRLSLALFAGVITLGGLLFTALWAPSPFGFPLVGVIGIGLSIWGLSLFGALGVHVLFSRFLSVRYWKGMVGSVLRFLGWRSANR